MTIENDKTKAQKPVQEQNSQPQHAPQGQNWQQGQKPVHGQPAQPGQSNLGQRSGQSVQVNSNKTTPMDVPNLKK